MEYELRDRIATPAGITNKTTILTDVDARSSDESVDRLGHGQRYPPGITKTTTMTVEVMKSDSSSSR
jgi:hypothetical protein